MLAIVRTQSRLSFKKIAQILQKPELQCYRRFLQLTGVVDQNDPDAFKWTEKDDAVLRRHVEQHGSRNWVQATRALPKWTCREIRRRYNEVVSVSHAKWTKAEDDLILKLYAEHGGKWTFIARQLDNRAYEMVKARYH